MATKEKLVSSVSNDILGVTIWKAYGDTVDRMIVTEINGQCAMVPAVEVYGYDGRLIACTVLGPGMTVHYI